MAALSDAFFELHEEDKAAVLAHHAATGGLSAEQLEAKPPSYWAARCRRRVRPEGELTGKLLALLDKYGDPSEGVDSSNGQMLVSHDTYYVFAAVVHLVEDGRICGECTIYAALLGLLHT